MYRLFIFLVPTMLLLSCSKDKFSEKDALAAQQTIDLLINVVDGSTSLAPVSGATVNAVVNGVATTQTTDASGVAIFTKVNIGGNVVVSVTKDQYTSVLTTVGTNPSSYRQKQVTGLITVFSKDPAKMATFKGRLTYQGDLTNRKREAAANVVVRGRNTGLGSGGDQFFTATTDADGKYTLAIPVNSDGNNITLYYPEFTANQKLAFEQENKSIAVAERSVLFKSNSGNSNNPIPSYPSAQATVTTPTGTGTGFAFGTKAERSPLSWYSTYQLISGGAGYNSGATGVYLLSFSADKNGVKAQLSVNLTSGVITSINGFVNNGATYDVAPTLTTPTPAPTTAATINFYFETTYKLYIANKGTGYANFPLVSAETQDFSSGIIMKYFDPNINDNSNVYLGYSNIFTNYTKIEGGQIKNTSLTNGDTLLTGLGSWTAAPTFTYTNVSAKKAVLYIYASDISTADSSITYITRIDNGLGYAYNTFPDVTITSLGGWGTGATAKATVSTSYSLSSILITNPGKKFVRNVNDYDNSGSTSTRYTDPSYPNTSYTVRPGDVITQDVYYGTGYQVVNQNLTK